MRKPDPFNPECPSHSALSIIGSKWSCFVIYALRGGPRRTGELRRSLDGISQKMLIQTLNELQQNGIVERTSYAEVPPRVVYHLTEMGYSLFPIIEQIAGWVIDNFPKIRDSQERFSRERGITWDVERSAVAEV